MGEWTFEYPWAFGLVVLFALCELVCRARTQRLIFPDTALLRSLSRGSGWLQRTLLAGIFMLLTLALASPIKQNVVAVNNDKGYEISLILDASGSMKQHNKFTVVKRIVDDFIRKRDHDKLSLTLFADFAYVAMPLTYDKKSLAQLLEKIDVGIAGTQRTALNEAIFMSTKLFRDSDAKQKIAILLTDGMDNTSKIPLDVAVQSAVKHGIKFYTVGVGGRGDFDPAVLQKIAEETGGRFFEATTIRRLEAIYAEIDALEKSEIKADKYIKKRYYFQYPLGAALVLLTLFAILRRRGHAL